MNHRPKIRLNRSSVQFDHRPLCSLFLFSRRKDLDFSPLFFSNEMFDREQLLARYRKIEGGKVAASDRIFREIKHSGTQVRSCFQSKSI